MDLRILLMLACCFAATSQATAVNDHGESLKLFGNLPFVGDNEDGCWLLKLEDPTAHLEKRQDTPTRHNISEVILPSGTGRWSASIEAQLQPSQPDISSLRCTLAICTGIMCGAPKNIGATWSTFVLKVQLRANEAQTISFVTSCSTPAYVALRNIVIPGKTIAALANITNVRTMTATPPASTAVSTVISRATSNAALGLAASIVLMNNCQHSWITIHGADDFEHIPPQGMALVPARPMDRFGERTELVSQNPLSQYCVTSTKRQEQLGCAAGTLVKRDTHPRADFSDKIFTLDAEAFEVNDVVTLDCYYEKTYAAFDDLPKTTISISNTGCDGVAGYVEYQGEASSHGHVYLTEYHISVAYDGNTATDLSIPYPAFVYLQTWSRNEPGWLDGTFFSIDGGPAENSAWLQYRVEGNEDPHSFEFTCNFATQDPPGIMTQVVYSVSTTTMTESAISPEVQWTTFTETDTSTTTEFDVRTETSTYTETSTSVTTEFSTTTEFETSACSTSTDDPPTPTPNPGPADEFWVDALNDCPFTPQVAITVPDLPDAFIWRSEERFAISADSPSASFPRPGRLCVLNQRNGRTQCGDDVVQATDLVSEDQLNIDCPQPPPARTWWTVSLFYRCAEQSARPVIVTQPQVDLGQNLMFTKWDSAGVSLYADDANPVFSPVTGGQLCVTSSRTGFHWCGYEFTTARVRENGDTLTIDCGGRPPTPDMSNVIPLNIKLNSPKGSDSCNALAVQIGCEYNSYCLGHGFENNARENDNINLQFPVLDPGARLRFKTFRNGRTQWWITFTDSSSSVITSYDRSVGPTDWVYVTVPPEAKGISLVASCHYY